MNNKILIGVLIVALVIIAVVGFRSLMSKENNIGENNIVKVENTTVRNTIKSSENTVTNNVSKEKTEITKDSKILIAYFSTPNENYDAGQDEKGDTQIVAGYIKQFYGARADLFKIIPVKDYPKDNKACIEFAKYEKENNARPAIKAEVDLSKYDIVFIGYPVWCGDLPMIINTFIENYDFSGKNIELFNTHEGAGSNGTYSTIAKVLSKSTVNKKGLSLRGSTVEEDASKTAVEDWLRGLNY